MSDVSRNREREKEKTLPKLRLRTMNSGGNAFETPPVNPAKLRKIQQMQKDALVEANDQLSSMPAHQKVSLPANAYTVSR